MKKEIVFILIFFILFLPLTVFAELTPDPVFVSDLLRINVSEQSSLKIYSVNGVGSIDFVKAKLSFFPRDEFRQKIEMLNAYPSASVSKNRIDFYF